jgi:hypothetical protein
LENVASVSNAGNVSPLRNKTAIKKSENLFQFCIEVFYKDSDKPFLDIGITTSFVLSTYSIFFLLVVLFYSFGVKGIALAETIGKREAKSSGGLFLVKI